MDFWLITSKLILLIYLVLNYIHNPVSKIPWLIFSFLLYLCVNMAMYIVKKEGIKKILLLLSIILIMICFYTVQPMFILLLPLSICELTADYLHKKIILCFWVMVPAVLLNDGLIYQYGLAAAFSLLVYLMAYKLISQVVKQELQMDKMRKDMQKLSKNLNENNDFIRQSEYTFKLEERNRLSQVFHDKIGHAMTGALIQMEASKRLLTSNPEKAAELLQNAINISKDGIDNIRITLKNMKPPTEQMGINRLKFFIEEFSIKHSIPTPFVYDGNMERITPIQWKIISENVTEALTNSLKYSGATRISVEIHVLNTMIRAVVKDNGKGVEKISKGLGIIGMEERTASIDGTIIVDGTNGFSVIMLLPLK